MPGAEWLGEHGNTLMTEASLNKVCVHTIVGYAPAHAAHFSVRADGHIYQSRDTRFRSAANYYGNDDVIAIENEDHGPAFGAWNTNNGHAVPGFTSAQRESIAKILTWAHKIHKIPLVACPDSRDASEGIAYHRQGVDGNFIAEGYAYGGRVAGGEVWTTSPGKVCPGDRRIKQLLELIIPRARVLAGQVPEDDDVTLTADQARKLDELHAALRLGKTGVQTAGTLTNYIARTVNATERTVALLANDQDVDVDALAAAVVAQQRDLLEEVIREIVPEDVAEQVVTRLGERLSAA